MSPGVKFVVKGLWAAVVIGVVIALATAAMYGLEFMWPNVGKWVFIGLVLLGILVATGHAVNVEARKRARGE